MIDPNDNGKTQEEAERLARVQKVEAHRLAEEEKRKTKLAADATRQRAYREKQKKIAEAVDAEAVERRDKEERSAAAEKLRQDRDDDIVYELSGEAAKDFGPNTSEQDSEFQTKIDDYLAPFESLTFERLYGRLSADPVGRAILRHFGIDPLSGYYVDSQGIHKSPNPGGRQVEMTDGSSEWISTDRIADYNEKNIAFKSQATLATEFRSSSPQILEMQIHNLKIKMEATRLKTIADEKQHREWLKGLERQYIQARKASRATQIQDIKERGETV